MFGINAWCWTMFVFFVGLRFMNHTNRWLEFGREASYPFFMIHGPVIFFIAFYVVQWQTGILAKILIIVLGSLVVTLGLAEAVRRIKPARALFGMKPRMT